MPDEPRYSRYKLHNGGNWGLETRGTEPHTYLRGTVRTPYGFADVYSQCSRPAFTRAALIKDGYIHTATVERGRLTKFDVCRCGHHQMTHALAGHPTYQGRCGLCDCAQYAPFNTATSTAVAAGDNLDLAPPPYVHIELTLDEETQ